MMFALIILRDFVNYQSLSKRIPIIMITKMLSFRLDFTGKKCSDINRVNRNVIVDETAVGFFCL